jgi:hypothetical protein
MTPVVTQVLVKKKTQRTPRRTQGVPSRHTDEQLLYSTDVAGFFIFIAVVLMVLMISLYA